MKKIRKINAIGSKAWEGIVERIKVKKVKSRIERSKLASHGKKREKKIIIVKGEEHDKSEAKKEINKKKRLYIRFVQGGAPGLGRRS